jgi:hypothetical protein
MKPEQIEKLRIQSDKILRAACDFQGKAMEAREKCRENFRANEENEENILRILIDGQIGLLAEKVTKKVVSVSPAISYQIGVSASFIRTHYLVTDLVLNGDLIEAIVLIRKQLESLARLHELDSKPLLKLTKKVPNIQNILKGSTGKIYGDLSEVAHFSTPRVAELLHVLERGELIGPSLLPVYSDRNKACLDMNSFVAVYFIAWMVEKLPSWYPGYDNSEDQELLLNSAMFALHCGVIQMPDNNAESGPSQTGK